MRQEMQGMYTLKKYCAITGRLKQEIGPFCNKITNIGLNRMGTTSSVVTNAYVGTGTAPAQFTDSAMGSQLTSVVAGSITTSRNSVSPYWHQSTRTSRFPAGTINGNITEVGVGWNTSSTNSLWSRELIVDSSGNPITLTVLANEFLDVVYSLRFYPSVTDFTGSVTINGTSYSYTGRTANINSATCNMGQGTVIAAAISQVYGGPCVLGAVTGTITGQTGSAAPTTTSLAAYVDGSLTSICTTEFALDAGNVTGGIKACILATRTVGSFPGLMAQEWQLVFNNYIPKTNANTMGLVLQVSWARYAGTIIP